MHRQVGKLTSNQEMYLKAIHALSQENHVARVTDIAKTQGVTKASVTSAMRHLADKGLIHYDPYSYVTLTEKGTFLAEELMSKYDVLSDFLQDVLHVPADIANDNACRMEHVIDDFILERLIQFLKFFKSCDVTFTADKRRRKGARSSKAAS